LLPLSLIIVMRVVQEQESCHDLFQAAARFSSGANFNSKIATLAPLPFDRFLMSIRPPCSSTIFFTIAKPSPVPRDLDVT
jgi:hypothetical protein